MPQKFLSVRQLDFERSKTRSPNAPWIKLHRSLFKEREFIKLSPSSRFLYIGLILLATEHENRIYNDLTWIGQLLYIPHTEIDLKPLYRGGFLQASNLPRVLEREREREIDIEREIEIEREREIGADAPPSPKVILLRGSVYPDGFQPDQRAEELAKGYGLNIHKILAAFRDHHVARGTVFKDWQAALRNWLRNEIKFAKKGLA